MDPSVARTVDIANIVGSKTQHTLNQREPRTERKNSDDFVDDPNVPPLE